MNRSERLAAYHDGELGPLARMRVRRALARDASLRAELGLLERTRALTRAGIAALDRAAGSEPDLWVDIRATLMREGALGSAAEPVPRGAWAWLRWAAPAAMAAVAVALALTLPLEIGDAAQSHSLRWLDAGDRSAMVLQDDREATIIWVLEPSGGVSRRGGRAFGAHEFS